MKLKNISRQTIKLWYYISNKDKNTNKERGLKMTDIEKRDLIVTAGSVLKSGVDITRLEDIEVKKMMKKIAANAVIIGLFNINGFVISNIYDGDFNALDKERWKGMKNNLNRCLEIIDNEGENLKDILTSEEIEQAVKYTIFEEKGESTEDE